MNKSEKKRKIKIIPDSIGLGVAMLIAGMSEALFLAFVLVLDILPFKYLALGLFLLLAIDAIIVYLATSESKHGTRRIGCLVIIFVMLITLLGGDYYIASTNNTLSRLSQHKVTWEYYDVLANKESSMEKVKDIKGKNVYVTDMDSKQLNEAEERLITKADVTYTKEPNFVTVGDHLTKHHVEEDEISAAAKAAEKSSNKSESSQSEAIQNQQDTDSSETVQTDVKDALALVSESQYKILKSNVDGFKDETKVIYRIKVKQRANDNSKAVDVTRDSFNILVSGLDSWGTIDQGGLSDVNMVMTVNPQTREVLLTSIPRDSYIPLHSYGQNDKLTHSGMYGEQETKATIEDFLDIDINYTVRVNFSMLVHLIHELGGIDVYSDYEFKSSISDHTYKKGWNHLYGMGSLYFARERKSFTDGDMQRNRNQQIVLEALLKKVTNSKVILTRYTRILKVVEDEMATDMTDKDLKRLAKMQLNDMKKWNIEKVSITGTTGLAPCFSMGGQNLSCVFPYEEEVEKAKKKIHTVMYPVDNSKTKNQQEKEKQEKKSGE